MGKSKLKNDTVEEAEAGPSYEELVSQMGPIASPLATKKMTKRLYKCIKKAQKQKHLRKGVREVQKFVRKGETGLVVLAGDTSPIDVICHMPLVCEEKDIPYCYTPSKESLGAACGSKRPTCMVMIKKHDDYEDLFNDIKESVQALPMPIS